MKGKQTQNNLRVWKVDKREKIINKRTSKSIVSTNLQKKKTVETLDVVVSHTKVYKRYYIPHIYITAPPLTHTLKKDKKSPIELTTCTQYRSYVKKIPS